MWIVIFLIVRENIFIKLNFTTLDIFCVFSFLQILTYQINLEWAIGLHRLKLQLIGLWHSNFDYHTSNVLSNIRYSVAVGSITLFCLIPCLLALQKVWGNLNLMIDNLNYTLTVCATVIKLLILWLRKEDLALMNDTILADWMSTKTETEIATMKKWARISRLIAITSISILFLILVVILILPWLGLSTRIKSNIKGIDDRFAMQMYFVHDTLTTSYFVITYIVQTFAVGMTAVSLSAVDSYLSLLVLHICGQFQNLNERLKNFSEFRDFKCGISYCVQEHIRLLRFVEVIDDCFSPILLMFVIYLTVLFCFQGFIVFTEISGGNLSVGRTILVICAIVITLGHFCMFSIVGEILVTQCELIYHTTYDYRWYELLPRDAKCLIFLMIRASKPAHITAGKFFPVTMSTFCSLLKTSAGYISVLLANQN